MPTSARVVKIKTIGGLQADALLSAAILIALWKLGALGMGKEIILPAPERVVVVFTGLLATPRFIEAIGSTAMRSLAAFLIAMLAGSAAGFFSGISPRFRAMLSPPLTVLRATPVLAIILLAMIWFPAGVVPVFSALVMSFPVVSEHMAAGVRSVDKRLVDMARSFGASPLDIARSIRVPSAMPHVLAAARSALGLSWKVVIAGEVLSQPARAIGTGMQEARLVLETAEVFAWALAGILLCAAGDVLFNIVTKRYLWPTR
ncbi:MAG: ABC transporter permease subunit [Spirochaetota bacterium]